jgi:hypothetical protein
MIRRVIAIQKKVMVLTISFLLTTFSRAVSFARPLYGGALRSHSRQIEKGILYRVAVPVRLRAGSATQYYDIELNPSFPYFHLRPAVLGAVLVPLAYADSAAELDDPFALTVRNVQAPETGPSEMYGPPVTGSILVDDDDDEI